MWATIGLKWLVIFPSSPPPLPHLKSTYSLDCSAFVFKQWTVLPVLWNRSRPFWLELEPRKKRRLRLQLWPVPKERIEKSCNKLTCPSKWSTERAKKGIHHTFMWIKTTPWLIRKGKFSEIFYTYKLLTNARAGALQMRSVIAGDFLLLRTITSS